MPGRNMPRCCSARTSLISWSDGMTRRDALVTMGSGFGMLGLANVLNAGIDRGASAANPLAPKPPHFPAHAKHVIFLFLNGGPSPAETCGPKPRLTKYSGQTLPSGNWQTG